MSLTLTSQANALLSQVIKQQGSLPVAVEQKLAELGQAADAKPVTIEQVEKLCRDAMPSAAQQKAIDSACEHGHGYHHHPDGKNNNLLTQILATRVRLVENFSVPRPAVTMRSDPYYGEFLLDKNAQSMLLFNARDVDAAGQALLMKVVLRMDPATEKKVAAGGVEIEAKIVEALAVLRGRGDVNVSAGHLRAAIGLPSEEAATPVPTSLKQQYGATPWFTELTALVSAHLDVKNQFIDAHVGALQLNRYRQADPAARPDVELVGAKATYVSTEDVHNTEFSFDLDSLPALQKANSKLEVRLYNAEGVPAQRMLVPFRAAEYV